MWNGVLNARLAIKAASADRHSLRAHRRHRAACRVADTRRRRVRAAARPRAAPAAHRQCSAPCALHRRAESPENRRGRLPGALADRDRARAGQHVHELFFVQVTVILGRFVAGHQREQVDTELRQTGQVAELSLETNGIGIQRMHRARRFHLRNIGGLQQFPGNGSTCGVLSLASCFDRASHPGRHGARARHCPIFSCAQGRGSTEQRQAVRRDRDAPPRCPLFNSASNVRG